MAAITPNGAQGILRILRGADIKSSLKKDLVSGRLSAGLWGMFEVLFKPTPPVAADTFSCHIALDVTVAYSA